MKNFINYMTAFDPYNLPSYDEVKLHLPKNIMGNFDCRMTHIKNLGFSLINSELVDSISYWIGNSKVMEVGCGTGHLSASLISRGVNVDSYDNFVGDYGIDIYKNQYVNVINKHITDINFSNYDVILMCWPDFDNDMSKLVVDNMKKGQCLIYLGENKGGCTANSDFFETVNKKFELLEDITDNLNEYHISFMGIHDWWKVYIKR